MTRLPEGIVTFLFTDVEGSTRLSQELGDVGWGEMLARHQRLLRQAFRSHTGHEVDTQGDAFFVVFTKVTDAVAAAIAGQRALERHAWGADSRIRVRMGIHTCEAHIHGENYVGQEVHRASRICAAGHGGQILLSDTTAHLVRSRLPPDTTLLDLGEHRLKDFAAQRRLFQLAAEGLTSEHPRLRTLQVRDNLPAHRSSFVGREAEMDAIRRLLSVHRVVTLTGIGGAGKTRLALQVAALERERFSDGSFFIDLSTVMDGELVPSAVAAALTVPPGEKATDERVTDFLADCHALLVMDNCEQVLDACAQLVDRVLAGCPGVSVLSTSREALAIDGERVWRVPSLRTPTGGSLEDVAQSDAGKLFVERAAAVRSGFALTVDNAHAVAQICRHLDGIPLALELAAARVAHLAPQEIVERLADRFRLLTAGKRTIHRQQTLQAVLDWSHGLLTDQERILLRRLSVFAGGWTLEAAQAVCALETIDANSVLDVLASLVSRSLVDVDDRGDHTRYRLLETVRMYAHERMIAAGEEVAVRTAHAQWFLRRAERAPEGTEVAVIRLWFGYEPADLVGDLDNMREAIDWWLAKGEYDAMIRIVAATIRVFQSQGRYDEPDEWLRVALEHTAEMSPGGRTHCYSAWAEAAEIRGRFLIANERARAAIAEAPTPGDAGGAYSLLVANMTWIDPDEADQLLERAAEWTVALGALADGYVRSARATVALARHDYASAIALLSRARYHAVYGIRPLELAIAYLLHGDLDRASVTVDEVAHRHDLQRWRDYYVPFIRGLIAAVRGSVGDARAYLADAVASIKRWKIPLGLADGVLGYAVVRFHAGDYARASELLAAVQTATRGGLRSPMSMGVYRHYVRAIRAVSDRDRIAAARARGAGLTLEAAIAGEMQHGDV